MLTESQLLTPDVLESPELNRVRFRTIVVIPSVVFDSDNDRKCLAPFLCCICDGSVPIGRVVERCADEEMLRDSSAT